METRNYTAQDAEQFEKAGEQLRKNGLDDWTDEGTRKNADLIDQFFQKNRSLPVTVASIYKAVEERKNEFVWVSAATVKWYETAKKNPDLANQLASFLATQGRPGQLANQGDSLFANLVLLFNEIDAHPQPIAQAEDRIAHRPGKHLSYVPQPRREMGTITEAARKDDGSPFLGDLVKNADGSYRSKTPAEQKRDREAAESAKSQTATPTQHTETAWETLCNQLRDYGIHPSQRTAMRETYDRGIQNGKSWREIHGELTQLKRQYETISAPVVPSFKAGDRSIR